MRGSRRRSRWLHRRLNSTYNPDQVSPLKLTPNESRANYKEQAHLLAEAGVNLLILEMMRDIEQASYAIESALSTGLPTWVGFSCHLNKEPAGVTLLHQPDLPLEQAINTSPSGADQVAPTGHTFTQGGFWHCMQIVGRKKVP